MSQCSDVGSIPIRGTYNLGGKTFSGPPCGLHLSASVYPSIWLCTNDGKVRCLTCERHCLLTDGQTGCCRTRQNRDGTIHTLTYGAPSSLSCNPIEKKPLYHFHPGSVALTAGSWSCNFTWPWLQNSSDPPSC